MGIYFGNYPLTTSNFYVIEVSAQLYTLFLDESGSINYPKFDPQHPILTVGGVTISDDICSNMEEVMRKFKLDNFGTEDVPLHYTDIINAKGAFFKLRDQVGLKTFLSELYTKKLFQLEWIAFAGVIDKPAYLRTYGTRPIDRYLPQDPLLVALTFVIERFVTFLEQGKYNGKIIYEARDPWRNAYIQWEYAMMHVNGTQYLRNAQFNRRLPSWIEFVPKNRNVTGLEFADLTVGPITHKVNKPTQAMIEWEVIKDKFWKGTNPSEPGQFGFKVFPGNLGRELLQNTVKPS